MSFLQLNNLPTITELHNGAWKLNLPFLSNPSSLTLVAELDAKQREWEQKWMREDMRVTSQPHAAFYMVAINSHEATLAQTYLDTFRKVSEQAPEWMEMQPWHLDMLSRLLLAAIYSFNCDWDPVTPMHHFVAFCIWRRLQDSVSFAYQQSKMPEAEDMLGKIRFMAPDEMKKLLDILKFINKVNAAWSPKR